MSAVRGQNSDVGSEVMSETQPLFSYRLGLKNVRTAIQIDSIDNQLRNGLWNAVWTHFLNQKHIYALNVRSGSVLEKYLQIIWAEHFKMPLDTLETYWPNVSKVIRQHFFQCQWNEVYDFIEFSAQRYPNGITRKLFVAEANEVLEKERAAYRFVGFILVPFTSNEEIKAIETALRSSIPGDPVTIHLTRSLELLADRTSPDYRNSIKEAISAVESQCKAIVGNVSDTLPQALSKITLHEALRQSLLKLYAYTSDADGIRHALMEESSLGLEDAQFMLVSCAGFVSYLRAKVGRSGVV